VTGKFLTRQFHHDSGHILIADFPLRGEYGALGTPPGGILLRDPSAAERDNVTIMFERPSAVNKWPYHHVLSTI
jgi:hypothetical protein